MAKRIRARVAAHLPVEYRHAGGQGQGILLDLALQGCRIKGACPLSCGARLKLQIWLPDQAEPVTIERAVFRWATDDQFGVSFLELSADAGARLAQVFQVLQNAQQAAAPVIPVVAAGVIANTEQDAALPLSEVYGRGGKNLNPRPLDYEGNSPPHSPLFAHHLKRHKKTTPYHCKKNHNV